MRKLCYLLTGIILLVPIVWVSGEGEQAPKVPRQKADPNKVKMLMHRKLDNAQKILEAIVMNDLDKVGKHAADMILVSREAEWMVYKTPQYEMNSDDFRRTAEKLVRQSKEKDMEGAKLTYLELTMTCFHCHRYVRDLGMARIDFPENTTARGLNAVPFSGSTDGQQESSVVAAQGASRP
jgi:hypothetical protein